MITLRSCPVCNSLNIVKYPKSGVAPTVQYELMDKVFVPALLLSNYYQCQNCHLIFQNPRMSDKEIDRYYKEGYYRKTINLTERERLKDEKYRAKEDAKIVLNKIGKINSHLDLGCGGGFFLKEVGAKIKYGVEPDPSCIKVKSIKTYSNIVEVERSEFDLVSAIHVLEHVTNPVDHIKRMAGIMSNDGFLVIEVPTWDSPGGPLRLAHLYHFEPDVLRLLLKGIGLRVIQTEFTPHLFLICQKIS